MIYSNRNLGYGSRKSQAIYKKPDMFGVLMPIPLEGINTKDSKRDIKDGQVSDANNVWISDDGFVETCPGYNDFTAVLSALGKTLGKYVYSKDVNTDYLIYAYDDNVDGYVSIISDSGVETKIVGKDHITGTATAGGATTLTDSSKTWVVNQWSGYYAKITAGTGIGQEKEIVSNTATALSVVSAWTTNPDATSVYAIKSKVLKDEKVSFASYINADGNVLVATVTATAGTSSTISKTSAGYTVDKYKGKFVKIVAGTGIGQFRQIKSNTTDTLTVTEDWKTTPDTSSQYRIVQSGNSMFFKQKNGWLMEWNGTDLIIYRDTPKGDALKIIKERLMIGGGDDSTMYASTIGQVSVFTGDNSIIANIGSENGQDVTAFLALADDTFVAFKENSYQPINGIETIGGAPTFIMNNVIESMGVCNKDAICEIPSYGAIILSKDRKIYPFGYIRDILSNVVGSNGSISDNIASYLADANLDKISLSFDEINDKIYICYCNSADSYNNKVLIYDYGRKELNPFWYRSGFNADSFFTYKDELYFCRSDKAQICKMTTDRKYNGVVFSSYVTFKDFSNKSLNPKEFDEIIFSLKNISGKIEVLARVTDASNIHQRSSTVSMGSSGVSGGNGAIISGLQASGSPLIYQDVEYADFIKRTVPLGFIQGTSIEIKINSTDYLSLGRIAVTGENFSEDEEDINIQF